MVNFCSRGNRTVLKVNEIYGNVLLMWLNRTLGKEFSSLQPFLRLFFGCFSLLNERHKLKKVLSPFDPYPKLKWRTFKKNCAEGLANLCNERGCIWNCTTIWKDFLLVDLRDARTIKANHIDSFTYFTAPSFSAGDELYSLVRLTMVNFCSRGNRTVLKVNKYTEMSF